MPPNNLSRDLCMSISCSSATTAPDLGLLQRNVQMVSRFPVAKKCISRPLPVVVASPVTNLFFLLDARTDVQFLEDTAANGSEIPTHWYETLLLSFGDAKHHWKFLVAHITLPLLSADIFTHFHLLVDVGHRRLVNAESYLSTPFQPAPSILALLINAPTEVYVHLLTSYQKVLRPELHQIPTVRTKHGIYHHIKTTWPTAFARFRCISFDYLPAAKQTFTEMEEMGVCQKASSTWSSPLHIILKEDGLQHYLILAQSEGFLHARKPKRHPKANITTPFGIYTFNYSWFDLHNARATFHFLMDGTFCVYYVDDILVFSSSKEEHLCHLHIVFDHLQQNGLVGRYKCTFGVNEVSFLRERITCEDIHPLPERVEAAENFPISSTIKALPTHGLSVSADNSLRFLNTTAPFNTSLENECPVKNHIGCHSHGIGLQCLGRSSTKRSRVPSM
ncbi:uncharacterized protein [Palaemon carinicauda]|uniref:uncharacterized protein n=1 Tax=Palaemon carinicauda TaxID=392227 RepID=UPI0035B61091